MEFEQVSEMLDFNSILKLLIIGEDFIQVKFAYLYDL
jgi:hypothetical protein